MSTAELTKHKVEGKHITLNRHYDFPPAKVWEVWTKPEHLAAWWGPDGFTITTHSFEFKVGGAWRYTMHGPDGTDYPNRIDYTSIDEPNGMSYFQSDDEEPPQIHFTMSVNFEEAAGGTELTMFFTFPSEEALRHVVENFGAIEGGKQHLANLDDYLQSL